MHLYVCVSAVGTGLYALISHDIWPNTYSVSTTIITTFTITVAVTVMLLLLLLLLLSLNCFDYFNFVDNLNFT